MASNVLPYPATNCGDSVATICFPYFHYTMSHGEPEQAKKSMNIIRSALIELVISMIAAVVVNFAVWSMSQ